MNEICTFFLEWSLDIHNLQHKKELEMMAFGLGIVKIKDKLITNNSSITIPEKYNKNNFAKIKCLLEELSFFETSQQKDIPWNKLKKKNKQRLVNWYCAARNIPLREQKLLKTLFYIYFNLKFFKKTDIEYANLNIELINQPSFDIIPLSELKNEKTPSLKSLWLKMRAQK